LNQLTYGQLFGFSSILLEAKGCMQLMLSHINPFLSPSCLPNKPIMCAFLFHFYWAKWLDLSGIANVGCGLAIVGLSKTPGPWLIYKEQPHASVCNV